jgi:pimeloyl-ACP methyl ester carboxylesterase
VEHDVRTPDGRTLHVIEGGDPHGLPVVVHHGTPGCALQYEPHAVDAAERGIRLISYDRPGYGGSTPHQGRAVADAAADVSAIADAFGIGDFGTYGGSGGGPHTLACAALLPDRVVGAVAIASVAPFPAEGLDWLAGMGQGNIDEFGAAQESRDALVEFTARERGELLAADPAAMVEAIRTLVSPVDADALTGALGDYMLASIRGAIDESVEGWVEDDLAFLGPWGFDLESISMPVALWHGEQDLFVPIAHGRWLAEHLSGVEVHIEPDHGHLSLFARVPEVHAWLVERFQA